MEEKSLFSYEFIWDLFSEKVDLIFFGPNPLFVVIVWFIIPLIIHYLLVSGIIFLYQKINK